jgi:hypothetical protein
MGYQEFRGGMKNMWFCKLFAWCEELTRLHRLSGLPSVWDSCTIASRADATAANLRALAQHSLGQLDQLQVRVLRSVQATAYPTSRLSALSGLKPTYRYSRSVHQLKTKNTYARSGKISWIGT